MRELYSRIRIYFRSVSDRQANNCSCHNIMSNQYKIAILARDCIHGMGPVYFGDVCALRWLTPLDEPTCVQRRLTIFWSPNTNKIGRTEFPYLYLHRRCGTRSNILLHESREHFRKELKTSCLGKHICTHQPLINTEE